MVTLKEIAAAAGVHVSTASAALNPAKGNTRVGEDARARVLAAARRLGYVPNESARRLRTGTSNAVGFLGGDFRNPFFAELAAALEKSLAQHGLQLFVSHVAQMRPEAFDDAISVLSRQGMRSIICWEESVVRKPKVATPLFSVGFSLRPRPGIWLDLAGAITLAVRGMKDRGFRQLGFYAPGRQEESPSVRDRAELFLQACKKLRLPRPVQVFHEGESWDFAAASAGVSEALETGAEAWISFNDVAALALLAQIPDVSRVVCFDGTSQTRSWPGQPPCLDLRIDELAVNLADLITGAAPAKAQKWLQARWVS